MKQKNSNLHTNPSCSCPNMDIAYFIRLWKWLLMRFCQFPEPMYRKSFNKTVFILEDYILYWNIWKRAVSKKKYQLFSLCISLDQYWIWNLSVTYFAIVLQMNPNKSKPEFHTLGTNLTQNDLNLFLGGPIRPKICQSWKKMNLWFFMMWL